MTLTSGGGRALLPGSQRHELGQQLHRLDEAAAYPATQQEKKIGAAEAAATRKYS